MIGRSAFQYNVIMARHLPAGPNNAHECLDLVRCKRAADLQSFYDDVIALGQLISSYSEGQALNLSRR